MYMFSAPNKGKDASECPSGPRAAAAAEGQDEATALAVFEEGGEAIAALAREAGATNAWRMSRASSAPPA